MLTEFNLVTGTARTVTERFEDANPGNASVTLANLPDGTPFIDDNHNVFISGDSGISRVNLESGQISIIDHVDPDHLGIGTRGLAATPNGDLVAAVRSSVGGSAIGKLFRVNPITEESSLITEGGSLGSEEPWGVAIGEDGTIYVSEEIGGRVIAVDPNTGIQRVISAGSMPGIRPIFLVSRLAAFGAVDADSDTLTFSMSDIPPGASFDSATKTFSWTPTLDQTGVYTITAHAFDSRGGEDARKFKVTVIGTETIANRPPAFLSSPPTAAIPVNHRFLYSPRVADRDGDSFRFDLVVHPEGMLVETNTGVVAWRPLLG